MRGLCECCGKYAKLEGHHAIIGRDKRNKDFCDNPMNISLVCKPCHDGRAMTEEYRELVMRRVIARYGAATVREWLDSAGEAKKRSSQWKRASFLWEWVVG